jgi:hypothetical protein
MITDENVEEVRTLLRTDRRLSIRMIAEKFNTGQRNGETNFNNKSEHENKCVPN